MHDFVSRSIELRGGFMLEAPVSEVFHLFSPLGEQLWVPDWKAELLDPPGASWERGQVFRTRDPEGEVVWLITHLDHVGHEVEYHRLCPGRYVARVAVRCRTLPDDRTAVEASYRFVGLSEAGNAEIARTTPDAYAQKMERWKEWIETRALPHVRSEAEGDTRSRR